MDVLIFGAGEMAEVAHYYLDRESRYRVVGFTVDGAYLRDSRLFGLPVLAFEEAPRVFAPETTEVYVAMSFRGRNRPREEACNRVWERGYAAARYVSPRAWAWDGFVPHGNTFVMESNVIQPYVAIGADVTVWSGNHIGHHTTIGDHCFIASHAVISGHVRIGDHTFVGVNATIRDNVTIGSRCIIGAGALVLHDVPDDAVVVGHETTPR